jgi:hypothetical protein
MRKIVSTPRPTQPIVQNKQPTIKVVSPSVVKPNRQNCPVHKEIHVPKIPKVGRIAKPLSMPSGVVKQKAIIKLDKPVATKVVKKKQPRYVTADITADSHYNIAKVRNCGTNRILAIIANGPSIGEMPLETLKTLDVDILSINHPDPRVWPTKYWAFFDTSQIRRHEQLWNGYDGIIFNSTAIKKQKTNSMQFKNIPGKNFSFDLKEGLNIGRSSVYASMQIALWMNYKAVFIFGVDMNPAGINGKLHYYGTNPDVDPKVRIERFKKEADFYEVAAQKMPEDIKKRFYFCSDYNNWRFVELYNKVNHRVAISKIREILNV